MSEQGRDSLNKAETNYQREFDNPAHKRPSAERDSVSDSRAALAQGEKTEGSDGRKAIADTTAGKAALAVSSTGGPAGRIATKLIGRIRTKEGGVGALIVAILLIISGVGLFTTFLAPVAFVENVLDDLNDQLAALDLRQEKAMRLKVSYDEKDKAFKGCTKLSIRCKAKSLSERQVKNFEKRGIKVNGTVREFAGVKRMFPKTYDYDGVNYKPAEFVNAFKTNTALRLAFKRSVNMRFMGFGDSRFLNWTQKKLGISKRAPTLSGTEEERIKKLATLQDNRITADSKFIAVKDAEGNDRFIIEGGDPNVTFSAEDVKTITERFSKLSTMMDSFGKLGTQTLKALSIIGFADMACSVKNMIGMAATTTRVLSQYQLAQYAANIAAKVHEQKAGDISPEDSVALNTFFMQTDQRKEITDLEATLTKAGVKDSDDIPENIEEVKGPNPYYGKNVMDSSLYKMSSTKGPPLQNETTSRYSLGFGRTSLLAAVGATAATIEIILNLGTNDSDIACQIIQNWAVRGIGVVVGVIAAIFSGGSSTAVNVAIMVGLMAAFIAANAALMGALSNDVVPDGIEKLPEDRATLTWTGLSVVAGTSAQSRAMIPASADEIADYNNLQQASMKDYIAIERQDAGFFDITNQYSPTGGALLALQDFTPDTYSVPDVIASLTNIQKTAFTKPFSSTVMAAEPTDRFKKCDDESYDDIGIDADVQCNVRYIMRDQDLNKDPDSVMTYMETNGYVEVDPEIGESVTGLPEGYTPPDPSESSNFIKDMAVGVVNQFYNTRTFGTTDNAKEYGKFLDYCVYRAMPYGNTYEESSGWGAAGKEWLTGEKCRSKEEMISNFRVYTMDVTLDDTIPDTAPANDDVVADDGGTGLVNGTDQNLAKQILASSKVTGDSRYIGQIQAYAKGDYSCNINHDILRLIATIAQQHTIYITSLNRLCTGSVPSNSSTSSPHYAQKGGHAVDIGIVDGVRSTGATAPEVELIKTYAPMMPKGSEVGQVQCRSAQGISIKLPDYITQFNDTCNHTHLNVPFPN